MATAKVSKLMVVILTISAVAVAGLTFAAITINQNVGSSGTVTAGPNVGIFSDAACTQPVTTINWGSVEAGDTATKTIYIEDTGAAAMSPSISVGSWSPSSASTYMTVTWSTLPGTIQPGVSNAKAVTLTLTVSSSITGISTFSNQITISGTG